MSPAAFSLSQLGWRSCYSQQLTLEDLENHSPARVAAVHRGAVTVLDESGEHDVTLTRALAAAEAPVTVGDWVLVERNASRISRILERASLVAEARSISPRIDIVATNALAAEAAVALAPWLTSGQSVAFVGSSGVGKSTLVNTLSGSMLQTTAGIREHDARGRHTTAARQLTAMPGGAWLIDTPGMRELKVGAIEGGVSAAFMDVAALAQSCRFRDCSHQGDDGCALAQAVADGRIEERRVRNYLKLQREAANAARTTRERRERDRQFGRLLKATQEQQRRHKQER